MPIWSIVIGLLATAMEVALSNQHTSPKGRNACKNNSKIFKANVEWKGANNMTLIIAGIMVSMGVSERDSMVFCNSRV